MNTGKIVTVFTSLLLLGAGRLMAVDSALINRAPGGGNLVLAIDAAAFVHSPVGAGQGWDNTNPNQPMKSPNPLPDAPGLKQLLVCANIETRTAQTVWQAGLLQLSDDFDLKILTGGSASYVDSIEGRSVAGMRGDTLFIDLGSKVLGVIWPDDRRFAAEWIRQGATKKISDYLGAAAAQTGPATPVVLAMDLADTVSEARVRRMLQDDPPAPGMDPAVIAPILASLQGMTLKIAMGDAADAQQASVQLTIDFAKDPAAMAPVAKAVVLQVLANRGLSIPDVENWTFAGSGTTVTAAGPLTIASLNRVLQLLYEPGSGKGTTTVVAAAPAADAQSAPPQQSPGVASQKYYQAISRMLDDISSGPSLKSNAGMLASDAREIDQLPILNVDADLVTWGTDVAAAMRNSASIFAVGQQRLTAQVESVSTPDVTGYQQGQASAAYRNAAKQRRQLAAQSKAETLDAAFKPVHDVLDSRNKIRQVMVQRYSMEF